MVPDAVRKIHREAHSIERNPLSDCGYCHQQKSTCDTHNNTIVRTGKASTPSRYNIFHRDGGTPSSAGWLIAASDLPTQSPPPCPLFPVEKRVTVRLEKPNFDKISLHC